MRCQQQNADHPREQSLENRFTIPIEAAHASAGTIDIARHLIPQLPYLFLFQKAVFHGIGLLVKPDLVCRKQLAITNGDPFIHKRRN